MTGGLGVTGLIMVLFGLQGLIFTAGLMHNLLHAVNIPLDVQEVRILIAIECVWG